MALFGLKRDIIALAQKSLRVMDYLLQALCTTHARCLPETASILVIFKWLNRKVSALRLIIEPLRTHDCGTAEKRLLGFLGYRILSFCRSRIGAEVLR